MATVVTPISSMLLLFLSKLPAFTAFTHLQSHPHSCFVRNARQHLIQRPKVVNGAHFTEHSINTLLSLSNHDESNASVNAVVEYPDVSNSPYKLIIDTRVKKEEEESGAAPSFVDGLSMSDLLMEMFGAQTVTTTKKEGIIAKEFEEESSRLEKQLLLDLVSDSVSDSSGDIFDEPDVDYSNDIAEELDRKKATSQRGTEISQSLNLVGDKDMPKKKRKVWNDAVVVARMPPTSETFVDPENIVKSLEELLDLPPNSLTFRVEALDEDGEAAIDWCKEVQKSWPPSLLSDDVVAALPFHDEKDCVSALGGDGEKKYDKVLLEGGSAFGTGDHPTSRMCGEWLLDVVDCSNREKDDVEDRFNVMDYGAGSGILALVALLAAKRKDTLASIRVEGVEVDPIAIEAARRNSIANGYDVPEQVEYYAPMKGTPGSELWDELTGITSSSSPTLVADNLPRDRVGSYDVLIANILAQPLVSLSKTLALLTKPVTGRIALSGLMVDQVDSVLEAYRPYFDDIKLKNQNAGWALLEGTRNTKRFGTSKES